MYKQILNQNYPFCNISLVYCFHLRYFIAKQFLHWRQTPVHYVHAHFYSFDVNNLILCFVHQMKRGNNQYFPLSSIWFTEASKHRHSHMVIEYMKHCCDIYRYRDILMPWFGSSGPLILHRSRGHPLHDLTAFIFWVLDGANCSFCIHAECDLTSRATALQSHSIEYIYRTV